MESTAQSALHQYILEHQKQIDALIAKFRDVLVAYDQHPEQTQKFAALDTVLGDSEFFDWALQSAYCLCGNNITPSCSNRIAKSARCY